MKNHTEKKEKLGTICCSHLCTLLVNGYRGSVCVHAHVWYKSTEQCSDTLSYSSERDRHTRRQTTSATLPQLLPTAQSDWLRQADSWTDGPEEAHMGG